MDITTHISNNWSMCYSSQQLLSEVAVKKLCVSIIRQLLAVQDKPQQQMNQFTDMQDTLQVCMLIMK